MQHHIATRGFENVCHVAQFHVGARGTAQRQGPQVADRLAGGRVENDSDIDDSIAFVNLPCDFALIGRVHGVQHRDRIEPPPQQVRFAQAHDRLRRTGRRLHLHIGRPGQFGDRACDVLGLPVERVEVDAEDVDHDRRGVARQRFFDPLGQEGFDREIHAWKLCQRIANSGLRDLGLFALERLQVDVQLAVMRAPHIVGLFGTTGALGHRADERQLREFLRNLPPHSQRLLKRGARHGRHVDDEVPLAQLGQKAAAQKRQRRQASQGEHNHRRNHRLGTRLDAGQAPFVAVLEPVHHGRLGRRKTFLLAQEHQAKRWRHGGGHQQRRQRGQHVGDAQRLKEPPADARQRQHRNEDKRDRERGVHHRSTHLERSVEDDLYDGARMLRPAVLAQSPIDVLDVDDRVVDHQPHGNGQPPQRHCVQADAEVVEHDHRRKQRQRDGGERDRCGAPVEKEHEQHDHDQAGTDQQRRAHVLDRGLDEVGRAEQRRMQRDALCIEQRLELLERCFGLSRHVERVAAVLLGDDKLHAHDTLDGGRTDRRVRRFGHAGDVAERHVDPGLAQQHGSGELRPSGGLPLGLDDDALVRVIDETSAAHACGVLGRCQDICERQVVLQQPVGMDLNLELLDLAAEDGHLRHAGHGQQARTHRPLGHRAQVHQRLLGRRQTDGHHDAGRGGQRRDSWSAHAAGQLSRHRGQAFRHDLPSQVHVAARRERDRDDRQPLHRTRSQRLDARQAVDGVFYRLSHQHFHLLGRESRRLGLDHHQRRREFRKDVVGRLGQDVGRVGEHHARQRDHDATKTQREPDHRCQEALCSWRHRLPPSSPTSICDRNSSDSSSCAPATTTRSPMWLASATK